MVGCRCICNSCCSVVGPASCFEKTCLKLNLPNNTIMTQRAEIPGTNTRARKITFRVLNIILIVGLLAGGTSQLFGAEAQKQFFIQLGYPLYLMKIIGT